MIEWLKPKRKHDPLNYPPREMARPPATEQEWQNWRRQNPPTPQPQPQRGYIDESQLPPHLQRGHYSQRPALSDRLQERREEFREYYGPPPETPAQYIPEPPAKKSRFPLIMLISTVALVIVGIVIALINFIYVRNAGQTIQSLTMIHIEIMIVLLCILLNTMMVDFKQVSR